MHGTVETRRGIDRAAAIRVLVRVMYGRKFMGGARFTLASMRISWVVGGSRPYVRITHGFILSVPYRGRRVYRGF